MSPHFNNDTFTVVGLYYRGITPASPFFLQLSKGEPIFLKREPTNKHDKNAVKCIIADASGEFFFAGYVPRGIAKRLAPILDRGSDYSCLLLQKTGSGNPASLVASLATFPRSSQFLTSPRVPGSKHAPVFYEERSPTGMRFVKHRDFKRWSRNYDGVSGVYAIWNRNHKIYIGQAVDVGARWREHFSCLVARTHHNEDLQHDWTHGGANFFRFDFLESAEGGEERTALEKSYIEKFDTWENGYNKTSDGLWAFPKRRHAIAMCGSDDCEEYLPPEASIENGDQEDSSGFQYEKTDCKIEISKPEFEAEYLTNLPSPVSSEKEQQQAKIINVERPPLPVRPSCASAKIVFSAVALFIVVGMFFGEKQERTPEKATQVVQPSVNDHAQKIVKNDLQQIRALYKQGNIYIGTKNYTKAIEVLQRATLLRPESPETWFKLGEAYGYREQYIKEIEAYRNAVRIKPDYVEVWSDMAAAYIDRKQYGKAIDASQQAIRFNPSYFEAWFNLGTSYLATEQHSKALESLQQAVSIKPDHARAWYSIGVIYKVDGRHDEAMEAYKYLKTIDPVMADDFFNGWILSAK